MLEPPPSFETFDEITRSSKFAAAVSSILPLHCDYRKQSFFFMDRSTFLEQGRKKKHQSSKNRERLDESVVPVPLFFQHTSKLPPIFHRHAFHQFPDTTTATWRWRSLGRNFNWWCKLMYSIRQNKLRHIQCAAIWLKLTQRRFLNFVVFVQLKAW